LVIVSATVEPPVGAGLAREQPRHALGRGQSFRVLLTPLTYIHVGEARSYSYGLLAETMTKAGEAKMAGAMVTERSSAFRTPLRDLPDAHKALIGLPRRQIGLHSL